VIIAGGPALAYWQENRPAPNLAANLTFPRVGAGWIIVPPSAKWYPVYAAPDRQLDNAIAPQAMPASAVDVKVLYYDRIRKKTSLISTMNRLWNGEDWYGVAERNADAKLGTRAVRFDENMISNASEKRLIWSSYWIDGQFTTSAVQVKLLQLKAMILGNEGTALITFSTPVNGPIEDARERLKAALLVLGDLPNDLDLASRPTQSSRSSD
jgi:EpsI family protein